MRKLGIDLALQDARVLVARSDEAPLWSRTGPVSHDEIRELRDAVRALIQAVGLIRDTIPDSD